MSAEQRGPVPPQLPERAKNIGAEIFYLGVRSVSRFAGFQAMHDSWEYSDAIGAGPIRRGKNVAGALLGGLVFPAATAAHQADLTELPGIGPLFHVPGAKKAAVAALGIADLFAWGGGVIAGVPTVIWRGITVSASEALPRRKAVYKAGLRRGL